MRSLLFVPADSPRKIEKALAGEADVVILDLEDSVALAAKPAARRIAAETLGNRPGNAPRLFVRVNPLDSGLVAADLNAILAARPDGIMQPKTQSGTDVARLAGMMPADGPMITAIATETADAMFSLGTYGEAGDKLEAMTWGAEDLSSALGATANRDDNGNFLAPYQLARSLCLFGARAAGVEPVDTVFVNFRDQDGLEEECRAAARDGFTGKMAIHPAQVGIINRVFTPGTEDVARARRIVDAFSDGSATGVIAIDGEMVDRPHVTRAEQLLKRARSYGIDT